MRTIDNLTQLRAEVKRLRAKKEMLEDEIENNFKEIKQDFSPLSLINKGAQKVLVSDQFGLVNTSVGGVVDFLLKKVLLRNSGLLARLVIPFLAKNLTKNYVHDHKTKILGWFGSLITKLGDNKHRKQRF
jgi:hypothetical protein